MSTITMQTLWFKYQSPVLLLTLHTCMNTRAKSYQPNVTMKIIQFVQNLHPCQNNINTTSGWQL